MEPSPTHVEPSLLQLRDHFESGATRSIDWRLEQLHGLKRLLDEAEGQLEGAVREDLGKVAAETWLTELVTTRMDVDELEGGLRRWARTRRARLPIVLRPGHAEVRHEPLGIVVVISPWNYPVNLSLAPTAATLAAGNCVALKPSEQSPATSATLARLLPRYLDSEAIAVIEGGGEIADALVRGEVDHVFFTGSAVVGSKVMTAAASRRTPLTLELGGKCPAVVLADADLGVSARRIAWGKFVNAGQTCIAPDYVLVEASAEQPFLRALIDAIRELYGENPHSSPDYARIVNERHFERLAALLEDHGGDVVVGGILSAGDRYVAPTVLRGIDNASPIMDEEIFGPILPVLAVDDLEVAQRFISVRPTPLTAYFFSDSSQAILRLLEGTRSGSVCVNSTLQQFAVPSLPFGGLGASGFGAYHGRAGFELFSHQRSVLYRRSHPDVRLLYPPYTPRRTRVLRRLL